jgi:hypothetical protein
MVMRCCRVIGSVSQVLIIYIFVTFQKVREVDCN